MTEIVDAVGLLRGWLEANEKNQAWLAGILCVGQGTVSRWMKGHLRPPADVRDAIEILTGVAAVEWMTAKEREQKIARDREVAAALSQRAA